MPTEKPRVTITMHPSQLNKIENYRYSNKFKNQTQAILSLIETGLSELERSASPTQTKTAPSISDEAIKLAKDYDDLDTWGQRAVRDVADVELARCEDEKRFLAETTLAPESKVITLYRDPAAAGYLTGETGNDGEPYVLGHSDPWGAEYAVIIQGDSMEPAFEDGTIVFVNHDSMRDGDIGIFCVDGKTVIKQWHFDRVLGFTYLFSLNRKRADADIVIPPGSGRNLVWQGRVITKRHFPLPE